MMVGQVMPVSPAEIAPEWVVMRHAGCGAMALAIAAVVVDNPKRKILNTHLLYMDGSEPKAGEVLRCKSCGEVMRLGPPDLQIDRGADHRQSLWQRAVMVASRAILGERSVVKPQ